MPAAGAFRLKQNSAVPDRGIFRAPAFSLNRADHHFSGVYSNPSLKRQFTLHPQAIRVALEVFLHAQGRVERALRMVLVRYGGAEQ